MSCFSTDGVAGLSVWQNSITINNTQNVFNYFNIDTWNNTRNCCSDPSVFPTVNSVETVKTENNMLLLNVVPDGRNTRSSSISSKEGDILYGSFRFEALVPSTPGTASGLFFFHSITEEIDMEFLSHENHVRLAIQPILRNITTKEASSLSQAKVTNMNKNEFKEYRFDWYDSRVDFYMNSIYYNTLSYNVPKLPGKIIINHRSNGNPRWSRGPPSNITTFFIRRINLYYNTSKNDACNKITPVDNKKDEFTFKKYGSIIVVSSVLFLLGLCGTMIYLFQNKPKDVNIHPPVVEEAVENIVKEVPDIVKNVNFENAPKVDEIIPEIVEVLPLNQEEMLEAFLSRKRQMN